jgi:hypothetical protein
MDWERVNSTVRELYWKKNGKQCRCRIMDERRLSDLIAKDAVPTFDEMTEAAIVRVRGGPSYRDRSGAGSFRDHRRRSRKRSKKIGTSD